MDSEIAKEAKRPKKGAQRGRWGARREGESVREAQKSGTGWKRAPPPKKKRGQKKRALNGEGKDSKRICAGEKGGGEGSGDKRILTGADSRSQAGWGEKKAGGERQAGHNNGRLWGRGWGAGTTHEGRQNPKKGPLNGRNFGGGGSGEVNKGVVVF